MDQLGELMSNYAELRRAVIDSAPGSHTDEALTHDQRMVALSDGVPVKPTRQMWGDEYEEKLAEYERKVGYKLSPLGNYVYNGPRSTDPQDQPIPRSTPEEWEANRGFFERWQEERKRAKNIA